MTLDGPNPSYAYTLKPTRPDAPTEQFEAPVGLEGRYRTGPPRPDGTIPAKGGWSYDGSFVIQSQDIGGDDLRKAILSCKNKTVDVTVMPEDGPDIELHGEVRD